MGVEKAPNSPKKKDVVIHPSTLDTVTAGTHSKFCDPSLRPDKDADPMDWTVDQVAEWIQTINDGGFSDYVKPIRDRHIVGWQLLRLQKRTLKKHLGMKKNAHIMTFKLTLKKL